MIRCRHCELNTKQLITKLFVLVTVTAAMVGCTTPMHMPQWLTGPGLSGPNAKMGQGLRQQDNNAPHGTGIDSRARDIERNLGYK